MDDYYTGLNAGTTPAERVANYRKANYEVSDAYVKATDAGLNAERIARAENQMRRSLDETGNYEEAYRAAQELKRCAEVGDTFLDTFAAWW